MERLVPCLKGALDEASEVMGGRKNRSGPLAGSCRMAVDELNPTLAETHSSAPLHLSVMGWPARKSSNQGGT